MFPSHGRWSILNRHLLNVSTSRNKSQTKRYAIVGCCVKALGKLLFIWVIFHSCMHWKGMSCTWWWRTSGFSLNIKLHFAVLFVTCGVFGLFESGVLIFIEMNTVGELQ